MGRKSLLAATLALGLTMRVAAAQEVAGVVAVTASDSLLRGARILLIRAGFGVVDSAYSDRRGSFRVRAPSPGPYVLSVTQIGYRPQIASVTLNRDTTLVVRVNLGSPELCTGYPHRDGTGGGDRRPGRVSVPALPRSQHHL